MLCLPKVLTAYLCSVFSSKESVCYAYVQVSKTSPPDVHLQLQQLISGTLDSSMPQHNDDSTDNHDFDDDTEYEPVSQDPFEDLYGDDVIDDEGDGDQSDDGSDDGSDDDASHADIDDVPDGSE